ncbi:MAG: hypothetical protein QG604_504 [Candidatus Dependentiae bacterium]|nr:hypothetical protein [Candidatus Dependentiae bacterium]
MEKCLFLSSFFVGIFGCLSAYPSVELRPRYVVAATVCISASLVNLCELCLTAEKRMRVKRVVLLREKNWAVTRRLMLTALGVIAGVACAWHAAEAVAEGATASAGLSQLSDMVSGGPQSLVEASKVPVLAAGDNVVSFALSGAAAQSIVWTFEAGETKELALNADQAAKLKNFMHTNRGLVPLELYAVVIADTTHFVLIDMARNGYFFDVSMNSIAPSWADLVRQKSVRTIGALSGAAAIDNALVVTTERCVPEERCVPDFEERSNQVIGEDRSVSTIFDDVEKLPHDDGGDGDSESEQKSESMSRESRSSTSSQD